MDTVAVIVRALTGREGYDYTLVNAADYDPGAHDLRDAGPPPDEPDAGDAGPPYALGDPSGSWYPVLDAAGREVDRVNGRANALAAVASLNAGTADGTPL